MTNKFLKNQLNLVALLLLLLSAGLYSCSEEIASDETPVATQASANVAPAASQLKSASLLPDVQISSVILYAGQTMNAGTVTLSQTDTNGDLAYDAIKVTYSLTGDWSFDTQVHFYIGTAPVPTNNGGNFAPGSFPYILTPSANPFSFNVPFSAVGFDGCTALPLNVAAHAELTSPTLGHQTGFGFGTPSGNWFTSYTVTLRDKTPPTASNKTLTVECKGDVPAENSSIITDASDNCSLAATPVNLVSEVSDENTCPETITRTYLVSDAAGNTTTVTYIITVHDKTPPVFDALPVIQPVACLSEDVFVTPTATDNCDSNPVVTVTNDVVTATSKTRTWTATDICGNHASISATVQLDVTAPVFSGLVANGTVPCEVVSDPFTATPSLFSAPVATDTYDPNPGVTIADKTETVPGTAIVWYTRTWTATDKCGNSVSVSQKLVKDCGSGFGGSGFPFDYAKGAGTGWAYDVNSPSISIPFSSLPNKTSNNWGWTNGKISAGTTDKYFILYVGAGQNSLTKGAPVGSVKVTYTGNVVNFQYWVISDCSITGVHFYAGTTALPKNKKGQLISAPGQLGVSQSGLTGSVTLPAGTGDIYIAAHANVVLK